jgi:hypothetical protein
MSEDFIVRKLEGNFGLQAINRAFYNLNMQDCSASASNRGIVIGRCAAQILPGWRLPWFSEPLYSPVCPEECEDSFWNRLASLPLYFTLLYFLHLSFIRSNFMFFRRLVWIWLFWDTAPCSLVETDWRFRNSYYLPHQDDEASRRNITEDSHLHELDHLTCLS